jgi:tRNA threonylcarbamoyladenosine biosynthesis protein TsaB
MSLILHVDCSMENATVALAENGVLLLSISNQQQKDHASFVHIAVDDIIKKTGKKLQDIEAIAVAGGPGSYTGLRVAMASAKGFCYALNKPLIIISTLHLMAYHSSLMHANEIAWYCPMIDARRMEVFTAVYDNNMKLIVPEQALILNENSFESLLASNKIYFSGNGAAKFKGIVRSKNAHFSEDDHYIASMCTLSFQKFIVAEFSDLMYSEPLYIKEFQSSPDLSRKK